MSGLEVEIWDWSCLGHRHRSGIGHVWATGRDLGLAMSGLEA